MKKKLSVILLVLLSVTMIGSAVFADSDGFYDEEDTYYISNCEDDDDDDISEVIEDINEANQQIDYRIKQAINEADHAKRLYGNDAERFERELDNIISELIEDTNEIAEEAIEEAAEEGVTVICELVEVEIHGRVVLVDPLRVGGF